MSRPRRGVEGIGAALSRSRRCLAALTFCFVTVCLAAAGASRAAAGGHWPSPSGTPAASQQPPAEPFPDTPGNRAFAEALHAYDRRDHALASQAFREALEFALASGDRRLEAGAHRGLALVAVAQGRHAEGVVEHEQALASFLAIGDAPNAARTRQDLGTAHYWLGHREQARARWLEALADYEALGDQAQQASALYNLTFLDAPAAERRALVDRALALARSAGAVRLEGQLLTALSDLEFTTGDYRSAYRHVQAAIDTFAPLGAAAGSLLARAYTSQGRILRAHALFDRATDAYRSALAIQVELDDVQGMCQTSGAIARALAQAGHRVEARRYAEEAFRYAQRSESAVVRAFGESALATAMLRDGDAGGAIALLRPALAAGRGLDDPWTLNVLAASYARTESPDEAITTAGRAIDVSRGAGNLETLFEALALRASALESTGDLEGALADAREAVAILERLQQRLVPHDYMKRGFMDQFQAAFTRAIDLLDRSGHADEAMQVAEQARARAFADLLLARAVRQDPDPLGTGSGLAGTLSSTPGPSRPATEGAGVARGAQARPDPKSGEPDLPSGAAAPAATLADLRALAKRLGSTVISYWVAPDSTHVWALGPDGVVHAARAAVSRLKLEQLVTEASLVSGTATASEGPSRGVSIRALGKGAPAACRELHRLLIEPLDDVLPSVRGSLLTIVPHGPLFRLSFAALEDSRRRYLIESHAVHYAPAAAVLDIATRARASPDDEPETRLRRLVVADPQNLPVAPGAGRLPPLPGSRREAAAIARLDPEGSTVLLGREASEPRVRSLASNARVLHFATHAIVRDDDPFESYLALDAGASPGSGPGAAGATPAPADDGRLTAQEMYGLRLRAELVVLSACRSGLGKLTGDGLVGMTRAFVYAGAPSVVATLWDVTDEPTARLIPHFYRALPRTGEASRALREAQLRLLRDLRAGRVVVPGRRGSITLPEHPALWAGFVLLGLP